MMQMPVERLRIGDTVHVDGTSKTVHALYPKGVFLSVHWTDGTADWFSFLGNPVDVIDFAPATDAEFADL